MQQETELLLFYLLIKTTLSTIGSGTFLDPVLFVSDADPGKIKK